MTESKKRPISPHLSIYKPQITSVGSIMHRMTGVFLYLCITFLVWIYFSYKFCPYFAEYMQTCTNECHIWNFMVRAISIFLMFCLYYHLLNGIRHLFWDIGKGFDICVVRKTGYIVFLGSVLLTCASIYYVII